MSRGYTSKENNAERSFQLAEPTPRIQRKAIDHDIGCPTGHMRWSATTIDEMARPQDKVLSCIICGIDTKQLEHVRQWIGSKSNGN